MMKTTFVLERNANKSILIDYQLADESNELILFAHGYKGYKDWGCWNLISDYFVEKGISFVKFNFSHNGGTIANPIDFPDLESFGQNNYWIEYQDLEDVINWCAKMFREKRIHLIGHSRGGGIALCHAQNNQLTSIHSWAGVSNFLSRITDQQINDWETDEVSYVINGRTNQKMPIYKQFYEALIEHQDELNISRHVQQSDLPLFFIHGEEDEAVSVDDSIYLNHIAQNGKLDIIKGAGHTFGAKQPYDGSELPEDSLMLCQITLNKIQSL